MVSDGERYDIERDGEVIEYGVLRNAKYRLGLYEEGIQEREMMWRIDSQVQTTNYAETEDNITDPSSLSPFPPDLVKLLSTAIYTLTRVHPSQHKAFSPRPPLPMT
ncbi:hypothetical protein ACMFMG_007442 [Clarireedia jacksonii]